jgi:hypothetical protein
MSGTPRKNMKLFGSTPGVNQVSQFGSRFNGAVNYTTDVEVIQGLSNWLTGWYEAVLGGNAPTIQDTNAAFIVFAYQLFYLFEKGVAEWNANTTYYVGSLVNSGGILYVSIANANLDNPLSDLAHWKVLGNGIRVVTAADTMQATDDYIRGAITGPVTESLLQVSTLAVGQRLKLKNVSGNGSAWTIAAYAGDNIDGQSSIVLNSTNSLESVDLIAVGSNTWDIV